MYAITLTCTVFKSEPPIWGRQKGIAPVRLFRFVLGSQFPLREYKIPPPRKIPKNDVLKTTEKLLESVIFLLLFTTKLDFLYIF